MKFTRKREEKKQRLQSPQNNPQKFFNYHSIFICELDDANVELLIQEFVNLQKLLKRKLLCT
jgi:hypothetical protein